MRPCSALCARMQPHNTNSIARHSGAGRILGHRSGVHDYIRLALEPLADKYADHANKQASATVHARTAYDLVLVVRALAHAVFTCAQAPHASRSRKWSCQASELSEIVCRSGPTWRHQRQVCLCFDSIACSCCVRAQRCLFRAHVDYCVFVALF